LNQIIPSLRGTAAGSGHCAAELPGRLEDRGGGAGLFADLTGLLWSFVGVCMVARPSLGEASGGERARLGCGDTSGSGGGGGALEGTGWGVRERLEELGVGGAGERET